MRLWKVCVAECNQAPFRTSLCVVCVRACVVWCSEVEIEPGTAVVKTNHAGSLQMVLDWVDSYNLQHPQEHGPCAFHLSRTCTSLLSLACD
jgi:hypothetical protein